MITMPTSALDAATGAAAALVTIGTTALEPLLGDLSTAAAIVVLTTSVRLVLLPLSLLRLRSTREQTRLAARVVEIRRRYRHQPGRLRRELAGPVREQRRGLVVSLLPTLAQLPFFAVLYRLCAVSSVNGHANLLLGQTLLGTPLGHQWAYGLAEHGLLGPYSLVFAGLFILLALAGWWSSRLTTRELALRPTSTPGVPDLSRVLRVLPFGTIAVTAFVPLAAGIYLLTSTTWTTAERWVFGALSRPPGPSPA